MKSRIKKTIGISEISILIISIISFCYFISEIPEIQASQFVPTGCCLEDNSGAVCQQMLMSDSLMCKEKLLATNCEEVEQCQKGCCYNAKQGTCSLNSPKEICKKNNGNWTNNPICNIPQCELGCCILGDEASITTTRECSLLSNEYDIEKDFQPLDNDGGCTSYIGLTKKGACVTPSKDFNELNDCVFTEKSSCSGNFYEGFLCTAKELNTICEKTEKTSCIEGKDEVYFIDSCNNQANVYDYSKIEDENYWTKVVPNSQLCQTAGTDCGNCNYITGSRCYERRPDRDSKPTYGNYVCRDLSCENGRKHGESWCIYDHINLGKGEDPVGNRYYKGICLDGELSIEGCADFNQEICVESTDTSFGFTESGCVVNEWRSCIQANSQTTYAKVKSECGKYEHCMMFTDISGSSEYLGFPGFKENKNNEQQGSARDVGKTSNPIITYCLPKYSPGLKFWSEDSTSTTNTKGNSSSSVSSSSLVKKLGSGGSTEETSQICGLGSFTCVKTTKKSSLTSDFKDDENTICFDKNKAQFLLEALNERCKRLGPCGAKVNILGQQGYDDGYSVKTNKIDANGKTKNYNYKYNISKTYLATLLGKVGLVMLGTITDLKNTGLSSGIASEEVSSGTSSLSGGSSGDHNTAILQAKASQQEYIGKATQRAQISSLGLQAIQLTSGLAETKSTVQTATTVTTSATTSTTVEASTISEYGVGQTEGGALVTSEVAEGGTQGLATSGEVAKTGTQVAETGASSLTTGAVSAITAVAAIAAYYIVQSVGKNNGWTPGETQAWASLASAGVSLIGSAILIVISTSAWAGGIGVVLALALIVYSIASYEKEYEFYIMTFSCESWEAPKGGDCEACNKDVRTCSEYRCKSLGSNCQYYTDNGEPGYCASKNDVWSAKITPWQEALTENHKYTSVTEKGFKIEQEKNEELEAWNNLDFGVETSKYATCRLDVQHTDSYDDMQFTMITEDNYKHKITISPHVLKNDSSSSSSTPGIEEGENQYYIRCKNFAGETNKAEFAVKLILRKGPDLTPPQIVKFNPESPAYSPYNKNSTEVMLFVNEPSECRYSAEKDENFENMKENMTCITESNINFLGTWACKTTLKNLKADENKFYFKCKDHPEKEDRASMQRNTNEKSTEYIVNVCSEGLKIASLTPEKKVISGKSPISAEFKAETEGCINGGEATCFYKFKNSSYISFFETGKLVHNQLFNSMSEGEYDMEIMCKDIAGNSDEKNISIKVEIDNTNPSVIRTYDYENKLTIITDEKSQCFYTLNETIKCGFEISLDNQEISKINLQMQTSSDGTKHTTSWQKNKVYYVKCIDDFNNTPSSCSVMVKTY